MTQPFSYNLLREKWLRAVTRDGRVESFTLPEIFEQAHKLSDLDGEVPIVRASLYRFLLAVLHSVLRGPADHDAWLALWEAKRFDGEKIEAYLEEWAERFDLFHPQHPFYQAPPHVQTQEKSVHYLILHVASGTDATFWDHHADDDGSGIMPDEAVRFLITAQTFGVGKNASGEPLKDAPWKQGIIFLLRGRTLFETLVLNLLPYPNQSKVGIPQTKDDRPAWEQDDPFSPKRENPLGYLDYLTWQNRRIRLFPERLGDRLVVRRMTEVRGLELDKGILDPMKHYVVKKKDEGWKPMLFSEERFLWRDSATILAIQQELEEDAQNRPVRSLVWLGGMMRYHRSLASLRRNLIALGMKSKSAKIDFYREEMLPLPFAYLEESELRADLQKALALAEKVASNALQKAAKTLARFYLAPDFDLRDKKQIKPQGEDITNLLKQWMVERDYWVHLQEPFYRLVIQLAEGGRDQALETWKEELRASARIALQRIIHQLGNTPRFLKARVKAEEDLNKALGKLLGKREPAKRRVGGAL